MGAIFCLVMMILTLIGASYINRGLKTTMFAPVAKWGSRIVFVFFLLLFVGNCFVQIDSGKVGVKVFLSSVRSGYIPEGFHPKNPFYNIRQISIRLQTMEEDAAANIVNLSQDQLEMTIDATQPFKLLPSAAAWLYQNVEDDYYNQILLPAARASVRNAVSKYNAQELVSTKRDEFAVEVNNCMIRAVDSMFAQYSTSLLEKPATIFDFPVALVRNIGLPEKLKNAIEAKLEAQQQSEAMAFVITKARQEADRKEIEAGGIKKFQDIVSLGISEQYLKWKGIEATERLAESPNTKIVIIGNPKDGLPVILGGDK